MHNHIATSFKSNYVMFNPYPNTFFHSPRLSPSLPRRKSSRNTVLNCRGIDIPLPKQSPKSLNFGNDDEKSKVVGVKDIDVATLGNLCVDIVLNVPELPSKPLDERKAYMDELSSSPPDKAESLTGIDNPILAGQDLLRKGIRTKWVFIKMGRKGSILITLQVDIVDTVGCGDSFVAAIAYGFIQKLPLIHTLTIANAVGAATAMGCGAGRNVANLRRIMELMNGSNLNEDDQFWEKLLKEHMAANEITLLTKTAINGSNNWLKRLSLQKVVCEALPELESVQIKQVGAY